MNSILENSPSIKPVVYRAVPNYQGIKTIWDWEPKGKQYVRRTKGLKFHAIRKLHGIQKAKSFESFEEAKKWRGSFDPWTSSENEMTFKEVSEKYFKYAEPRLRSSTFDTYQSKIRHLKYFDDYQVSQIDSKLINQWLESVKQPAYLKLQHKTRLSYKHELSLLRQILIYFREYLADHYELPFRKRHHQDCVVDIVKYRQAKVRNKDRYIPRSDLEAFAVEAFRIAEKAPKDLHLAFLSVIQAKTGLRIGEACALNWNDIDFETGLLKVTKTVIWSRKKGRETIISPLTKTGEPRVIPVTSQVLNLLSDLRTKSGRKSGLIFTPDGFSITKYRSIQYFYNKAFDSLGLQWKSTHILRHSFATDFLEITGNSGALQSILGHKNLSQTEHYAKVTENTTRAGINSYQGSFGALAIDHKAVVLNLPIGNKK